MTTAVKLPLDLEQTLLQHCAEQGRSISEVMRDALVAYLAAAPAVGASTWSLGADLFGRHAGLADLASARRQYLADAWDDKHSRCPA